MLLKPLLPLDLVEAMSVSCCWLHFAYQLFTHVIYVIMPSSYSQLLCFQTCLITFFCLTININTSSSQSLSQIYVQICSIITQSDCQHLYKDPSSSLLSSLTVSTSTCLILVSRSWRTMQCNPRYSKCAKQVTRFCSGCRHWSMNYYNDQPIPLKSTCWPNPV